MRKLVFVLLALNSLAAAVLAAPKIELVDRNGITLTAVTQNSTVTNSDIDKLAVPLYEKFLSKSSFADLTVERLKEAETNHSGTFGWKWYTLELSDKEGNRFTGFLDLRFETSSIEDPRTGKFTYILKASVEHSQGALTTNLRNLNRHIILKAVN